MVSIKWTPPDPNWKSPASKGQNKLTTPCLHLQTSSPRSQPAADSGLDSRQHPRGRRLWLRHPRSCSRADGDRPLHFRCRLHGTACPPMSMAEMHSAACSVVLCHWPVPLSTRLSSTSTSLPTAACCTHVRRSIRKKPSPPAPASPAPPCLQPTAWHRARDGWRLEVRDSCLLMAHATDARGPTYLILLARTA